MKVKKTHFRSKPLKSFPYSIIILFLMTRRWREYPDVDNFDACYLPDGRIVFASTASYTGVPCWHGVERACSIYLMDADGGIVQRIPGRAKPIKPIIRNKLVDRSWPKFLHPYPLSDKYFLVSSQLSAKSSWGIYLVDVFDNILPIYVQRQFDLFEPTPLRKTPCPPVVRVSCEQTLGFCRWLSQKTGMEFTLPTEAQREYACRAGSQMPLSYGVEDADLGSREAGSLSTWANVADKALSVRPDPTGRLESNITAHFGKGIFTSAIYGSNILCDTRFNDGTVATTNVGSYRSNAWGLYDMHCNACEWTRTTYKPYPYKTDDGRDWPSGPGRKVVRGGSWCDRPKRCRSAFRLSYPAWQRVYNVGFRVICEGDAILQKTTKWESG